VANRFFWVHRFSFAFSVFFAAEPICFGLLLNIAGSDAPKAEVVAGGADLAFAARADHVARAVQVGAQK